MKEVPHKVDRYLTRRDALKAGVGLTAGMLGAVGSVFGAGAFGLSYVEISPELVAEEVAKGKSEQEVLLHDTKIRRKARKIGGGAFLLGVPAFIAGSKASKEADRVREQFGFDDFIELIREQKFSTVSVAAKTTKNYGRSPELLRFGMAPIGFSIGPEFSGYLMETTMVAVGEEIRSLGYTQTNKYQYAETPLKGDQYTDIMYELELRNLLTAHERAGLLIDRLPGVKVNIQISEGLSEDEQSSRLQEALTLGLEPFPMYIPEKGDYNLPDGMIDENFVGPFPK